MRFTFSSPVVPSSSSYYYFITFFVVHVLRINCSCASMVRPFQRTLCTIRHYIIKISWLIHIQRRKVIVCSSHPCARRIRGCDAALCRRKLLCYLVRRTHFFFFYVSSIPFLSFFFNSSIPGVCARRALCMQMHYVESKLVERQRFAGKRWRRRKEFRPHSNGNDDEVRDARAGKKVAPSAAETSNESKMLENRKERN